MGSPRLAARLVNGSAKNGVRRHLSPSQRAAIGVEMLPQAEKEARERERQGGGDKRSQRAKTSGRETVPDPIPNKGKGTEHVAKIVGVNPRYVQDAKLLKERAPVLFESVKKGDVTLRKAVAGG